ncbi:hypothetical protein LQR31_05505 [Chromobacterium vaccinii]|uniref:hypothetical protein n=1 Tax=Chromobacterium vaccinii TaxID=1108595 RepID=UPI001E44CE46|nr:hypothetical protein [Chromobacterium vaccinii]MCD4483929.1 hypothetical protein [Chromobacterium vaccinii]
MKALRTMILFDQGNLSQTVDWANLYESYIRSISHIDHPIDSGKLTIRRMIKKTKSQSAQRNGVQFLRRRFLDYMVKVEKWIPEGKIHYDHDTNRSAIQLYPPESINYFEPITSGFGEFDFLTQTTNGMAAAIEWETGNISSSHRSLNKLTTLLSAGIIKIGVLILPSRDLYTHLTDRIGNIGELSPYLNFWQSFGNTIQSGMLAITVVEHDELSDDPNLPFLAVGNDGRAAEGKKKTQSHEI